MSEQHQTTFTQGLGDLGDSKAQVPSVVSCARRLKCPCPLTSSLMTLLRALRELCGSNFLSATRQSRGSVGCVIHQCKTSSPVFQFEICILQFAICNVPIFIRADSSDRGSSLFFSVPSVISVFQTSSLSLVVLQSPCGLRNAPPMRLKTRWHIAKTPHARHAFHRYALNPTPSLCRTRGDE
jgi:hypothetical protein